MICPHCKKHINTQITEKVMRRARELKKLGYSLRHMEKILFAEGHHVTYSTLGRHFKDEE